MQTVNERKAAVALLSVVSNATLVTLKVIVGLAIGSVSVVSEAIHSGVDLLAAVIALFAVRASGRPADQDHNFGHGKVENLSGTVEAVLIFGAAGWIVYEASKRLIHPAPLESAGWGVGVMLVSAAANTFVARMLFKVGKETDSMALRADAWHLATDVYTSAGVMVGLGLIWLGQIFLPGADLKWIDPVAAIGVALLIVKAAYDLTVQSARDLFDVSLPAQEENLIREHIKSFTPTVRGYHRLRTRKSGAERFVEFHMLVDAAMSVGESHRITDIIENAIKEHYPGTSVTIHIEPCVAAPEKECPSDCSSDCLLAQSERKAIGAS